MHKVPYAGILGNQKTFAAVKKKYYWPGMKKEIVDFISRCMNVKKSRLNIDTRLVFYNPCPFLSGNGKSSPWISSLSFQELPNNMIP
jgi:hypothetical protein